MSACPDKLLAVHALADNELDAANALALEAHLAECAGCRAEYERVRAIRALLADKAAAYAAPAGLADRIGLMLDAAAPAVPPLPAAPQPRARSRGPWRHVASWRWASGALTGLAAGLLIMVALPHPGASPTGLSDQLVAGHVRSLLADHLTDVQTSDKHLVKPWFNGRIDFAPPVPELVDDGFPLLGGRVDYVGGRNVAAIVYGRRLHRINVFVMPSDGAASAAAVTTHKEGYNLVRWSVGGLDYWAVSDLNTKELQSFQSLFATKAAG
ncbi:anti-sigma factor family protein [Sphingomonas nostoxanthinifaciens]|uniref:anti-sigma factor family protein n=1 Tax=Sphingomonas nostoxanthinifaciens TaxID=2872652 RepID=UPI001CC2115A|nr:anti-sigma factor [Sphingomonas nostoxanthinifaciens]UAK24006.1 anti-sigma factor [Sphingomonas nostoxanthinifaciens]